MKKLKMYFYLWLMSLPLKSIKYDNIVMYYDIRANLECIKYYLRINDFEKAIPFAKEYLKLLNDYFQTL